MLVLIVLIGGGLLLWLLASWAAATPNRLLGFGVPAGLSVITAYLGGSFGVFVGWLTYLPLGRFTTPGPVQLVAVWLQAAAMTAGVAFLLRRHRARGLPVLTFAAALFLVGALGALDPWGWTIHPS